MLEISTPCGPCDATGWQPSGYTMWRLDTEGAFVAVYTDIERPDPNAEPAVVTCTNCNGLAVDGLSRARYHSPYSDYGDPYKTLSTLKAAHTKGKATVCKRCAGVGQVVHAPVLRPCYRCDGAGKTLTWNADVDPIAPEAADLCNGASPEFMADWLHTAQIVVVREDRGATWGEAHLGLGSMYSAVDYGRTRGWTDQQFADRVREELTTTCRPQLIKMTDTETRRVGNTLLITVRNDGYSVSVADVRRPRPMLPPTYTDALLDGPA
jgi:hypothetical protein